MIPPNFSAKMVALYREAGQSWVDRLPNLLNELAERWQVSVQPPFKLSYNYVAPVKRANGSMAVLKVGFPNPQLRTEIEALRLYNGSSICKLLAYDAEKYALLLEYIQPGQPLWTLANNEQETIIAAQVMQKLWQPISSEYYAIFPSLAQYTSALLKLPDFFDDGFGPFPRRLVETAVSLREELLANTIQPMLLHGDFHHENVLNAKRQPWLALDPKGVIGDAAYEIGAFLYNPNAERVTRSDLICRICVFSEVLGIDKQRLISWGIVQAVLSAVWSCEENKEELSPTLLVANLLVDLLA